MVLFKRTTAHPTAPQIAVISLSIDVSICQGYETPLKSLGMYLQKTNKQMKEASGGQQSDQGNKKGLGCEISVQLWIPPVEK